MMGWRGAMWRSIDAGWPVVVALVAGTLALHGQLAGHPFLYLDDPVYLTENPQVRDGLSWAGLAWAFTTMHAANWHPLTWLSHMLDVELFGLSPGAHHLVNVALHAASAAILFVTLARMTGARGRSAVVAALFAVHPLHVESVAWVAERKDVLSTLFGLLSLWAYARYAERPGLRRYVLVALFLALSLLSKPMWVTLPFLLLLIDVWPLQRLRGSPLTTEPAVPELPRAPLRKLLLEKVPLLALSVASSIVTVVAQYRGNAVASLRLGLASRLENAAWSYASYLGKVVWPSSLSVYYPYPGDGIPGLKVAAAITILLVLTAIVLRQAKRQPWLALGWCWFLGTLVPVIGIVQVGGQAMADRYMYLPIIGLFIAGVWSAHFFASSLGWASALLPVSAAAAIAILSGLTWRQIGHWETNESLFRHAIAVTQENGMAHGMLATSLGRGGRHAEALVHAREAVRLEPWNALHWVGLAAASRAHGSLPEARSALEQAVQSDPKYLPAWSGLADVKIALGDLPGAAMAGEQAARLAPEDPRAWCRLGLIYAAAGRRDEAVRFLQEALRLQPDHAQAREAMRRLQQMDSATH